MSQKITEGLINPFRIQGGNGVPTHISTIGSFYVDKTTGDGFFNKNGISNWAEIYDTSSTFIYAPMMSAMTMTANTIFTDYIDFNTGTTSPSNYGGRVFYDNTSNSLAYYSDINQNVKVEMGQQLYIKGYNNTGALIPKGSALSIQSATAGLPNFTLAKNIHYGFNQVVGLAASDIPNGNYGLALSQGILSGITLNTYSVGDILYASPFSAGTYVAGTSTFPFTARTNQIGFVIATGTTNGKIYVSINNEDENLTITDIERNILEGNVISCGVYEFSGITKVSNTLFSVAQVRGWIVKNTNGYATRPDVINVDYSGTTGTTTPYLTSVDQTYILVNSASTLTLQSTFPTPQERRENIFLGKLIHPARNAIQNVSSTVDFDVSPMAAIRDIWVPLKLINVGVIPSPNGSNLSFNTSAGTVWGNGIGWTINQLNPDSLTISAQTPTTFQYRTQLGLITGGTAPYTGNTTLVDPAHYDLNGVVTAVGGGSNSSTNQRIYLFTSGLIRVQYGQQVYSTLAAAVSASQTESFIEYSNNRDNGILIGILSVNKSATNLSDTTQAVFNFVSKFGEILGGTGGLSTTTLQQAYNNSSTPEIIINAALDGLTIQNGTGNADVITHLLEGQNTAGATTSFIKADGSFSGSAVSAITITTPSVTANASGLTVNGRTNLTDNAGNTIVINSGFTGTFGNGGFTVNGVSTFNGIFGVNGSLSVTGGTISATSLSGTNLTSKSTYGTVLVNAGNSAGMLSFSGSATIGGPAYVDFIRVTNTFTGATNPNKTIRVNNTGGLEFLNSAYTALTFSISDVGAVGIGTSTTSSNDSTSNYLFFNNNNSQIYDDGNMHIHSRTANQALWINTNNGTIFLGNQSPVSGGGAAGGILMGSGSTSVKAFANIYGSKTYTIGAYGFLAIGGAGTGAGTTAPYSLYCNNRIEATEFDATSDERLKDIQGEISLDDAIDLIKNVKPIKFTWKDSEDKNVKSGYSAQQVEKAGFKHLIGHIPNENLESTTDNDGFTSPEGFQLTMSYDQVTPYHGVVIKHLLEKINDLEKQIQELKNK